jgi:hypothetical protein
MTAVILVFAPIGIFTEMGILGHRHPAALAKYLIFH